MINKQTELIGSHPMPPNQFGRWLVCDDVNVIANKCHRLLSEKITIDSELIDWLAKKLIQHHYGNYALKRLKQKFSDIGYPGYAELNSRLPRTDKVKKCNTTEILLIEYIESCLNKELIKAFRFRYNPNVDQSMKGDDALLVDLIKNNGKTKARLYLGEAKFRTKPTKQVVDDILATLSKDKKPISYSFLVDTIARQPEGEELADSLDDLIIDEIKGRGDIIYTGFLLSNENTSSYVESNLDSDNPQLVFVSVGIENPEKLVEQAFKKAEELITNPNEL